MSLLFFFAFCNLEKKNSTITKILAVMAIFF